MTPEIEELLKRVDIENKILTRIAFALETMPLPEIEMRLRRIEQLMEAQK